MRKYAILLSALFLTACHKDNAAFGGDQCQAPTQPKLITVAGLTTDQKADAMGVPPSQVPADAVGGPAFDAFVAISRRRSGVSFLALASPPRRPISARISEILSS